MKNDTGDVRQKLINRALNLLSYRPQSVGEMKLKLKRSGVDPLIINQTIEDLIQQGKLDDLKFSRWWVEQRIRFRPRGNIALTQELKQKGISKEIIDEVLLPFAEELRLAKKLPPEKRLSRGFSYNVIDALNAKE